MDTLKSLKIKRMETDYDEKRNVMILFSATVALTLAACGSKEQSSSTSSTSGTKRNTLLKSLTMELQLKVEH